MTRHFSLTRRGFLVGTAAGGLSLGFRLPAAAQGTGVETTTPEVNAWVVIRPDDTVVVRVARIEMGQGTLTGLAQLVAEELDADWEKVTWEYPTPGENVARDRVWGAFGTYGSQGIRNSQELVRQGGAVARAMLLQAAANRWGVDPSELSVEKGVITGQNGEALTYGELAPEAAELEVPTEVTLKDPSEWTIAGQPVKRLDTAAKLDGSQVFAIDLQLDGMMNAAIRQAPHIGATVASFDADAVVDMPGVQRVIQVGDNAVAVVADTWWRAKTALDALPIEWNESEHAGLNQEQVMQMLDEGLSAEEAFVGNENGDVRSALDGAAQVVEADYHFPWQHHATMEPMNATALVTDDRAEVWVATQDAEADLAVTSETTGFEIPQCEVHRISLGGGFGRRASSHDFTRQAVLVAMEMPGTPVKLIWSREEDMLHGTFHPITKARFRGALDENGDLTGLHMRISGQSIMAGLMPFALQEDGMDPMVFQGLNADSEEGEFGYTVPNLLIDHAMRNPPLRPGFWRGVNNNQNSFYLESFMDELAEAAGRDPLEFRRALMQNHPKHLAVLEAVAEGIGWDTEPPEGVHRGLSQHMGYGSYVAAAAEVSVTDGRLRIHRIVAATNCGHVVNPQQVEAQIEGSFAYGLSAGLLGEITLRDGRVQQENFDTYPVVQMWDMPAVEKILMPDGEFWGGVGEPTIFVATPAVLNAVYRATGKRIRVLPLSQHDLDAT